MLGRVRLSERTNGTSGRRRAEEVHLRAGLACAVAALWLCVPQARAQLTGPPTADNAPRPIAHEADQEQSRIAAAGSIHGVVTDTDGGLVVGASIALASAGSQQHTSTGSDGSFHFAAVAPGSVRLTITAPGRAADDVTGAVSAGQDFDAGVVVLHASADMSIEVLSPHGLAEVEVKREEHQRLLGFAPNFYVSYDFHAPALDRRQKWELNWRTLADPVNIGLLSVQAGVEQATGSFSGFGPGASGYGKRLGAASADFVIGSSLQGWLLPVVFRQDPRYFYMGTGTRTHRALYALSTAVIARGDNGRWQPAYANVLGSFSTGAISNLYYPAQNTQGATLTFENGLLSLAFDGLGNVLQEFVFRHVSTGIKKP